MKIEEIFAKIRRLFSRKSTKTSKHTASRDLDDYMYGFATENYFTHVYEEISEADKLQLHHYYAKPDQRGWNARKRKALPVQPYEVINIPPPGFLQERASRMSSPTFLPPLPADFSFANDLRLPIGSRSMSNERLQQLFVVFLNEIAAPAADHETYVTRSDESGISVGSFESHSTFKFETPRKASIPVQVRQYSAPNRPKPTPPKRTSSRQSLSADFTIFSSRECPNQVSSTIHV